MTPSPDILLKTLNGLIQDVKIYPSTHPTILASSGKMVNEILTLKGGDHEIRIDIYEREIIYNKTPYIELSEQLTTLIDLLESLKISTLIFRSGVTADETSRFAKVLSEATPREEGYISWYPILYEQNNIRHIFCGNVSNKTPGSGSNIFNSDNNSDDDNFILTNLEEIDQLLQTKQNIDLDKVLELVTHFTPNVLKHYDEFLTLGTLKEHSATSFEHTVNVAVLSCLLGAAISLPEDVLDSLVAAAFLHDVGKKKIPLDILNKPGKLTKEERTTIETHAPEGTKELIRQGSATDMGLIITFEHHLELDGSGYPRLRKKRSPCLVSRIVAIADFYDALRGSRVYRGEVMPEEVYNMMQELRGIKFDPDLLDLFFRIIGVYPPGIHVILTTNEIARVVKAIPEDIFRPVIDILTDRDQQPLTEPKRVSLTAKTDKSFLYSIKKTIPPIEINNYNFQPL